LIAGSGRTRAGSVDGALPGIGTRAPILSLAAILAESNLTATVGIHAALTAPPATDIAQFAATGIAIAPAERELRSVGRRKRLAARFERRLASIGLWHNRHTTKLIDVVAGAPGRPALRRGHTGTVRLNALVCRALRRPAPPHDQEYRGDRNDADNQPARHLLNSPRGVANRVE
jgi:hypothetical protein